MKKFTGVFLCLALVLSMAGCARRDDETVTQNLVSKQTETMSEETAQEQFDSVETETTAKAQQMESAAEETKNEYSAAENLPAETAHLPEPEKEEKELKLYFNDTEIPVTWEDNDTVRELSEEAAKGDITVSMSMYGGWEQVGSLGRSYSRNDRQMSTVNGDIVLYSGNQIVVFYGSNSWAYTKLGKMNLSENEVTDLLSNGDITLILRYGS